MFWEFSLVNQTTKNKIKIIQQTKKSSGIYPFEKLPKTIYSMEKCLWKDNQNGKTFKFSVMIKQTNKQTKTLSKHQIKMYFPSEKKLRIFFSLNSHQTNKQTNGKKTSETPNWRKYQRENSFIFFTSHKQIRKFNQKTNIIKTRENKTREKEINMGI